MFLNDAVALIPREKATSEEYNYSEGHIAFLSFLFLVEKETHKGFLGGSVVVKSWTNEQLPALILCFLKHLSS